MESRPPTPEDSTPPHSTVDEPVQPVPTRETTPVWAQTSPAAPAQKKGDPDWSKTESTANGDSPKQAPAWAQTVPTAPGAEAEEPDAERDAEATAGQATVETERPASEPPTVKTLSDPPRAVAADAMKSTWPPTASSAPAPPEETDIWPPEPPTEHAMPAWPPPSELEEPEVPAQPIPSWPDSFEPMGAGPTMPPAGPAAVPPTLTPEAKTESQPEPPEELLEEMTDPPSQPATVEPASIAATAPTAVPEAFRKQPEVAASAPAPPEPIAPVKPTPLAPKQPARATESEPVAPAQSGPPGRPAWAPGPVAEAKPALPRDPVAPSLQVPAWAPRVPLAGETGKPTWFSPKEAIPHATAQPISQPAEPATPVAPAPPIVGGQLPVAPIPAAPASSAPAQPASSKSTWEIVEQQRKSAPHAKVGPTAEDRSYAEWFAWAKRGGAPASACHAAAQGAFKALSSGKDVNTAVQWATAAMSSPAEPVSQARQGYCAWFALGNIDLNLDQHRAHLFAAGAIQALDLGQDPSAAHAAGLAAAGIK